MHAGAVNHCDSIFHLGFPSAATLGFDKLKQPIYPSVTALLASSYSISLLEDWNSAVQLRQFGEGATVTYCRCVMIIAAGQSPRWREVEPSHG